jgi:RimJ/RimL family protein N-acetyltransferase
METKQQLESQEKDQQPSSQQNLNDLVQVVPYVKVDGNWILEDEVVGAAYQKCLQQELIDTIFWETGIEDQDEFIAFAKKKSVIFSFVYLGEFGSGDIIGFVWLTGLSNNHALGHFCFFKEWWGDKTVEAGRIATDYWFSFEGENSPLLDTIIGMVPAFNKRAHRYVEKVGFSRLGVIPRLFKNPKGDREHAVIFYLSREGNG